MCAQLVYLDCSDADDAARLATPLLELLAAADGDDDAFAARDARSASGAAAAAGSAGAAAALARADMIELEASGVDDDGGEVAEDEEVEEFELPPVRVYFDDAKKKRKGAKKRN